jgi:hypothetical protein
MICNYFTTMVSRILILASLIFPFANAETDPSASSSFGLGFGFGGARYSHAASQAAQELARQEQEAKRRKKAHHTYKSERKKTMEEAMQSAKQLPKLIADEDSSGCGDDEASSADPPLTFYDDSDSSSEDEDEPYVLPTGLVREDGDQEASKKCDTPKRQRRNKRRTYRKMPSSKPQPQPAPTTAPTFMPGTTIDPEKQTKVREEPEDTMRNTDDGTSSTPQQHQSSLIGQMLLSKFVITEQIRVGSTKSELFKCFHISDYKPNQQQFPLVIKLSQNKEQMELEHRIYSELSHRQSPEQLGLFVKVYDWIAPSPLTNDRAGFAMECGLENLRGYIWRHGPYTGDRLRDAMRTVIRIVHALHQLGTIWTEVKAENLIVFPDGNIKAVDLESVAAHGECLRCYTAETYPPEFPPDSLYQSLPQIPLDYSFDSWGLGLVLLEMAIGEPLFTLQRTYDVEYIKHRLQNPQGIVDEATQKLQHVEEGARNVILQCLVEDPAKRSTCDDLLNHDYFQKSTDIQ